MNQQAYCQPCLKYVRPPYVGANLEQRHQILMERIQEAMKKSKMTQLELAKRSGIAAQYLNRVLLCKNWPSLKMLLKIEDALGIKIIWNENE